MNTLFTILAVLALVGSILLTLVVLLQNSKGGGLASNFTAGNQTFGVRQTTDILEKITWGLAIFILVVSIAASFSYSKSENSLLDRANQDVEESTEVVDFDAAQEPAAEEQVAEETPAAPAAEDKQ